MIDLPSEAVDVLRTFKKGSKSEFVSAGAQPNLASTYDYYRCDCTWRDLPSAIQQAAHENGILALQKKADEKAADEEDAKKNGGPPRRSGGTPTPI